MSNSTDPATPVVVEATDESGFTLIELLIVIVIMGILAAVVVFALGSFSSQSAVAACNTDAKSVEVAVQAYNTQTGGYPASISTLAPNYLRTVPSNPSYYAITVGSGGVVDVALTTTDPGNATGVTDAPGTTQENYDTFSFAAGDVINGNTVPTGGANICAGA